MRASWKGADQYTFQGGIPFGVVKPRFLQIFVFFGTARRHWCSIKKKIIQIRSQTASENVNPQTHTNTHTHTHIHTHTHNSRI